MLSFVRPGSSACWTRCGRGGGLVLEFGCGTGLLTKELVAAGHRVIATDASPAMLDIARELVGNEVEELKRLTLPDDALPQADAVVAVGHPINYLPDADAIERALVAIAGAVRPAGGLVAFNVCDLEWGVPVAAVLTSAGRARLGDHHRVLGAPKSKVPLPSKSGALIAARARAA
jgi:SAM-dependent methyltransferase